MANGNSTLREKCNGFVIRMTIGLTCCSSARIIYIGSTRSIVYDTSRPAPRFLKNFDRLKRTDSAVNDRFPETLHMFVLTIIGKLLPIYGCTLVSLQCGEKPVSVGRREWRTSVCIYADTWRIESETVSVIIVHLYFIL